MDIIDRILLYGLPAFMVAFVLWSLPSLIRWRRQVVRTGEMQHEWEHNHERTTKQLDRSAKLLDAQEEHQKRMFDLIKRWEELADRAESTLDELRRDS